VPWKVWAKKNALKNYFNHMKNTINFLTISFLIIALVVVGCERHHHVKQTKQTVRIYKQSRPHALNVTSTDNDFLWWYIIYYNNTYYYYSSPTPLTPASYSTIQWQSSLTVPSVELSANAIEEGTEIVANESLGSQMEATIDTTEAQIDAMVNEGNPNTGETTTESSSSSDSGGSSGGDSGGGGGE
jgi:uncharacterized membrane protein YgcG